jgi:hypothetical protein
LFLTLSAEGFVISHVILSEAKDPLRSHMDT